MNMLVYSGFDINNFLDRAWVDFYRQADSLKTIHIARDAQDFQEVC
jgi:hypothetical protein